MSLGFPFTLLLSELWARAVRSGWTDAGRKMAGAPHIAHFDPFYRHLVSVLADDAESRAAFGECGCDLERVQWLDAFLDATGVVLRPQRDGGKDHQLAAQMLDAARSVAKLRADFE